jgi:hypothetical protein
MSKPPKAPRSWGETDRERAIAVMNAGWCPWPYVAVPVPGDVDGGKRATCRCGKLVNVTVRGLYSHHKMAARIPIDEIRPPKEPHD